MSIFREDLHRVTLDEVLAESVVQNFLLTLFDLVPFFTKPQINLFLHRHSPRGISGRLFHNCSRTLRHRLVEGGYLRTMKVEYLPPVTIGTDTLLDFVFPDSQTATSNTFRRPILDGLRTPALPARDALPPQTVVRPVIEFDYSYAPPGFFVSPHLSAWASQLTEERLSRLAATVRGRVPGLETHQTSQIYYATSELGELVRSGYGATGGPGRETHRTACRSTEIEALVAGHPSSLNGVPPSSLEIALSDLTAAMNLTQLHFTNACACTHHEWPGRYEVLTQGRPVGRQSFGSANTLPEPMPDGRAARSCGQPWPRNAEGFRVLYFLGPLLPHAIRDRLLQDGNAMFPGQKPPHAVWWM